MKGAFRGTWVHCISDLIDLRIISKNVHGLDNRDKRVEIDQSSFGCMLDIPCL